MSKISHEFLRKASRYNNHRKGWFRVRVDAWDLMFGGMESRKAIYREGSGEIILLTYNFFKNFSNKNIIITDIKIFAFCIYLANAG